MKTSKQNILQAAHQYMKRAMLLSLALLTVVGAQAGYVDDDFNIQPRVGVSFSTLAGDKDAKMKVNVTYGLEAECFLSDNLSLAAGILFTNQGAKYDEKSVLNNYYAAIPVTFNLYVLPGLAIKAGVQPAYRVKTNVKYAGVKVDLEKFIEVFYEGTGVKLNHFDLSVPVGLSYTYGGFTLDARYNLGVTKNISGTDENLRNSMITVTFGLKL